MSNNEKETSIVGKIRNHVFSSNIEEIRVHLINERCPNCFKTGDITKSQFVCECGISHLANVCLNCGLILIP